MTIWSEDQWFRWGSIQRKYPQECPFHMALGVDTTVQLLSMSGDEVARRERRVMRNAFIYLGQLKKFSSPVYVTAAPRSNGCVRLAESASPARSLSPVSASVSVPAAR